MRKMTNVCHTVTLSQVLNVENVYIVGNRDMLTNENDDKVENYEEMKPILHVEGEYMHWLICSAIRQCIL